MDTRSKTEEAVALLGAQDAFLLIQFYENAANTVKGRAWAITTWILAIDSALLAYSVKLYVEKNCLPGFLWIQGIICLVGLALCGFLYIMIRDQGAHLSGYWTKENKVAAWNAKVRNLVLSDDELDEVQEPEYRARFPRFCSRLILLSFLFAIGFIIDFLVMFVLVTTQ